MGVLVKKVQSKRGRITDIITSFVEPLYEYYSRHLIDEKNGAFHFENDQGRVYIGSAGFIDVSIPKYSERGVVGVKWYGGSYPHYTIDIRGDQESVSKTAVVEFFDKFYTILPEEVKDVFIW